MTSPRQQTDNPGHPIFMFNQCRIMQYKLHFWFPIFQYANSHKYIYYENNNFILAMYQFVTF